MKARGGFGSAALTLDIRPGRPEPFLGMRRKNGAHSRLRLSVALSFSKFASFIKKKWRSAQCRTTSAQGQLP
jgi:hypothetical protein